jgi:hypothetical protein
MLTSQRQQLRCIKCEALFETDTPTNCPIDAWIGYVKALRCPKCGANSKKIALSQSRTILEDRAFERGTSYNQRIAAWLENGEIGSAAQAIHRHMTGPTGIPKTSVPSDTADFRRCLLLLDRMPEWTPRMPEMASLSPTWATLVAAWPDLTAQYTKECGSNLDRKPAPETHRMLKAAIGEPI